MNCLEAQSKITSFIDDNMEDEEMMEFINHIKSCDNCAEELEIYYTLLVGMKQLDDDGNLSSDFKGELEKKINSNINRINSSKRVRKTFISISFLALLVISILGYFNYKELKYNLAQDEIRKNQPDYYYSYSFSSALFHTKDYELTNPTIVENKTNKEFNYFISVKKYQEQLLEDIESQHQ